MKKAILFLAIAASVAAQAQQKQSLKDLLYSGKLKLDSNSVVRKDDDLSAKIDTAAKKPAPVETQKMAPPQKDLAQTMPPATNPVTTIADTADATATTTEPAVSKTAAPPKSNTKIWKEYTDSLISGLKADVLPNKKIKKDTYFVIVEYELGETGTVNVTNVTSSPENPLLQSEVKSRLDNYPPPQLQPVVGSDGKGRKVKRKQSFSITKE